MDDDGLRDVVGRFGVEDIIDCAPHMSTMPVTLVTRTHGGRSFVGVDEAQTVNCP